MTSRNSSSVCTGYVQHFSISLEKSVIRLSFSLAAALDKVSFFKILDEIRPGYHMDETCQRTVPEAIIAFLESQDFEDAIRNAVSLGGDTDTLGAITGSIAEAFYGIPAVLVAECRSRLDEGLMTDVLDEFDHALGRDRNVDSDDKNGTPGKVL